MHAPERILCGQRPVAAAASSSQHPRPRGLGGRTDSTRAGSGGHPTSKKRTPSGARQGSPHQVNAFGRRRYSPFWHSSSCRVRSVCVCVCVCVLVARRIHTHITLALVRSVVAQAALQARHEVQALPDHTYRHLDVPRAQASLLCAPTTTARAPTLAVVGRVSRGLLPPNVPASLRGLAYCIRAAELAQAPFESISTAALVLMYSLSLNPHVCERLCAYPVGVCFWATVCSIFSHRLWCVALLLSSQQQAAPAIVSINAAPTLVAALHTTSATLRLMVLRTLHHVAGEPGAAASMLGAGRNLAHFLALHATHAGTLLRPCFPLLCTDARVPFLLDGCSSRCMSHQGCCRHWRSWSLVATHCWSHAPTCCVRCLRCRRTNRCCWMPWMVWQCTSWSTCCKACGPMCARPLPVPTQLPDLQRSMTLSMPWGECPTLQQLFLSVHVMWTCALVHDTLFRVCGGGALRVGCGAHVLALTQEFNRRIGDATGPRSGRGVLARPVLRHNLECSSWQARQRSRQLHGPVVKWSNVSNAVCCEWR